MNKNTPNQPSTRTKTDTPTNTTTNISSNSNSNSNSSHNNHANAATPFYHCHNLLDKVLFHCSNDPVNSVHRAWSITLVMIILYSIISIFQLINLHKSHHANNNNNNVVVTSSNIFLILSCLWNIILQFGMVGLIGTFIIKRFPTSFAIGFLFGIITVMINLNLIYMITFHHFNNYNNDNNTDRSSISRLYSAFSFLLAFDLFIFSILLFHFQKYIIVAPIDAKGFNNNNNTNSNSNNNATATATTNNKNTTTSSASYQRYDDGSEA